MAMHLSAQTGEQFTPEQLLGREDKEKAEQLREAQASLVELKRKMSKAGVAG